MPMENIAQNGASMKAPETPRPENRFAHEVSDGRLQLIAPFHEWLVGKRNATYLKLKEREALLRDTAPLTLLALDRTEVGAEMPAHVIDFAQRAAEAEAMRRELDAFDVFFVDYATKNGEESLDFSGRNSREAYFLWNWFLNETINAKEVGA